ncbi:hypothetical protein PI125_g18630 [Phytophthora idaei]|nr:hypothetical protein PI125_g18630 [Phytophthora idaei]
MQRPPHHWLSYLTSRREKKGEDDWGYHAGRAREHTRQHVLLPQGIQGPRLVGRAGDAGNARASAQVSWFQLNGGLFRLGGGATRGNTRQNVWLY